MELNRYGHGDRGSRTDTADSFALVSPVIVAGPSERSFSGTILAPRPRASGLRITAANGNQYRLTLADDRWTSAYLPPEPVPVGLGMSGEVVLVGRTEGGSYQVGEQSVVSGSIVRSSTGAAYRLVMQDGAWTATFELPPPVVVSLGASGQVVRLQLGEDGNYRRDGQPFASGTTVEVGGEAFELTLQNGRWTAISQAPVLQMVRLGTSAVTLTLQRSSGGGWTEDGETVRNGEVRTVGNNRYRLLLEDGEWSAEYLRGTIPVDGAGGLIILFQEEDGTLTHNGDRVSDGSVITQDGRSYELLRLSDGTWLATPGAPPPAAGDQTVSLPGGQTVTLRRTSGGTYTYNGAPVSDGGQITVGANRYVLTRASDDTWSARAVADAGTIDPGGIGGPTQTDEKEVFTELLFDSDTPGRYGVGFLSRDGQPEVDERGTQIVPLRLEGTEVSNRHKFPVYDLMRQGLISQKRTAAEVAKAELEEIIARIVLRKPLYAASAAYPDNDIQDEGMLWDQAEDAVARIFGWVRANTDDAENIEGILGRTPWNGRLDTDEVDDVIATLQDVVATLSDVDLFARDFEDEIDDANGSSANYDADDFFGSVSSRIRFGSTGGTRFGAYAVTDAGEPAASNKWDTGVFAYTPERASREDDIPTRGVATFRGDTVAVADGSDGETAAEAPKLYAGKIELVASFSKTQVTGTITALTDEDGRALEATSSDSFRKETVGAITLPAAPAVPDKGEGFYEVDDSATVSFARNLRSETATSTVRVQLVGEASEALGIWTATDDGLALNLEGSFGATRTGAVTAPALPRLTDDGGKVNSETRTVSGSADFLVNAISTDVADDENTITLSNTALGMTHSGNNLMALIDWYDDNPNGWTDDLEDLHPARNVTELGDLLVATARTEIRRLQSLIDSTTERNKFDDPNTHGQLTTGRGDAQVDVDRTYLTDRAATALELVFGGSPPALLGSDARQLYDNLVTMNSALSSETRFKSAVEADGVFAGEMDYTAGQISDIFDARDIALAIRFDSTRYTRFGIWSESAPLAAEGAVSGNTIAYGAFGYSPLKPEGTPLTFVADYAGETLAVNENNGDLYSGTFELTVNWGASASNITARIINLKGVYGSTRDWFQHDSQDVGTIFLSGIGIDGDSTAVFMASLDTTNVRFGYRASGAQEGTHSGTAAIDGKFVGNDHSEGPLGVLGTWSITESAANGFDFTGSFGADLKP